MLKNLLAVSAVSAGVAYWYSRRGVLQIFKRFDVRKTPVVLDIAHVDITFKSETHQLYGNLFGENIKGLIVFSHGLGLGSDDYFGIVKALVNEGYQVLAYDNTGTFRSEGKSTVGLNQGLVDLRNALNYVMENDQLDKSNLLLVGHSAGGYAVAAILNDYKKYPIKGIVSLAGSNKAVELLWHNSRNGFEKSMIGFTSMYHLMTFGKDFFYSSVRGLNKSKVPALIVHGVNDVMVRINDTAIMAHRDEIKNPLVEYFIRSEKEHNGHNSIFEDIDNPKKIDPILLNRIITFFDNIKN